MPNRSLGRSSQMVSWPIELCGGFGAAGTARIAKAVEGKAAVGAVRFDIHPGLGNRSGDTLFA